MDPRYYGNGNYPQQGYAYQSGGYQVSLGYEDDNGQQQGYGGNAYGGYGQYQPQPQPGYVLPFLSRAILLYLSLPVKLRAGADGRYEHLPPPPNAPPPPQEYYQT